MRKTISRKEILPSVTRKLSTTTATNLKWGKPTTEISKPQMITTKSTLTSSTKIIQDFIFKIKWSKKEGIFTNKTQSKSLSHSKMSFEYFVKV